MPMMLKHHGRRGLTSLLLQQRRRLLIDRSAALAWRGSSSNYSSSFTKLSPYTKTNAPISLLPSFSARWYSHSTLKQDDAETATSSSSTTTAAATVNPKKLAQSYNNRRASYKKAVSELRKQYAEEVAAQRRTDEKARTEQAQAATRARLERQRLKNIRSVRNAVIEEEKRLARAKEFEEELAVAQVNREARRERFEKARRLVLQELEEEAPMWLTTREEVNVALESESAIQALWGRPGGYIGVPTPTDDAAFWRYEGHTWDMSKTYPSPREILLEEIEEMAYEEVNVDKTYWNEKRIEAQTELEEKAKLRALVREEGRKALLLRQRRAMQDLFAQKQKDSTLGAGGGVPPLPSAAPAPALNILANYKAMEREGVKLLESDPTKFFKFETEGKTKIENDNEDEQQQEYSGQSLGKPIGLRDPVRENSPTNTPYPEFIGRLPKPDTRTEKEKKRDEREQRMWAAAQAEAASAVEFAAEDDFGADELNYDEVGNLGDDDDIEWEKDLDPDNEEDKFLLDTPRERRYTEEDLEWIVKKLEEKVQKLQEIVKYEEASAMQTAAATKKKDRGGDGVEHGQKEKEKDTDDSDEVIKALGTEHSFQKKKGVDEKGREYTGYDIIDDGDIPTAGIEKLVDMQDIESVLESLNEEQIEALVLLEDDQDGGRVKSMDEIKQALGKVPGLTQSQIQSLVELEMSLSQNDELLEELGMKADKGEE